MEEIILYYFQGSNIEEKVTILRFLNDMNSVTKDTFLEITEKYINSDN